MINLSFKVMPCAVCVCVDPHYVQLQSIVLKGLSLYMWVYVRIRSNQWERNLLSPLAPVEQSLGLNKQTCGSHPIHRTGRDLGQCARVAFIWHQHAIQSLSLSYVKAFFLRFVPFPFVARADCACVYYWLMVSAIVPFSLL